MHRRNFLALLSTPALAALIAACSNDRESRGETPPSSTGGNDVARSDLTRSETSPADSLEASSAVNQFGMDLYRHIAGNQPHGNIVLSPASIAIALTMAVGGAKGTTLDEMVKTLHIDSPATIHHAMNAMLSEFARRTGAAVELSIANSLWVQAGFAFDQRFLDLLAAEYGAGLQLVDYRADSEAARRAINTWVDEQTKDRIPELLADGVVTSATRLALVNAIYLKAPWLQPFDRKTTHNAPFTTTDGTARLVPMMVQRALLPYTSGDGFQAVELAYESDDLAMLLFLPEPGILSRYEQEFLVTDATSYLTPTDIAITLPKFSFGASGSLADPLRQLAMVQAFSGGADFTGITSSAPVRLDAVVHHADISVDEQGTQAAAATAVVIGAGSGAPSEMPPLQVTFDRPFLVAIRDRGTEAILFVGRVGDPTS